jgi:hypothetical protein
MSTAQITELAILYLRAILHGGAVTFTMTRGASATSTRPVAGSATFTRTQGATVTPSKPIVGSVIRDRMNAGSAS